MFAVQFPLAQAPDDDPVQFSWSFISGLPGFVTGMGMMWFITTKTG
jgi:hypothetical protein